MTGMEAWSLIAPLIGQHIGTSKKSEMSPLAEAYVIVFKALGDYDKRKKEGEKK